MIPVMPLIKSATVPGNELQCSGRCNCKKLHNYLPSAFKEPTRRLRAAKGAAASAAGVHALEDAAAAAAAAAAAGAMLGAAAAKLGTPTGGDAVTCCAAWGQRPPLTACGTGPECAMDSVGDMKRLL
jgi:hypothetical protein